MLTDRLMAAVRACLIAGMALTAAGAAFAAAPMDLVGSWRGTLEGSTDGTGPDSQVSLDVRASDNGISISWRLPSGRTGAAGLAPGKAPGVYEPENGGLFGMFRDEQAADPLEGRPLQWARIEGAALIVYTLTISVSGGYILDRLACTRTEDGVTLQFSRRRNGAEPEDLRALLTAAAVQ
jgi:hypothetical protein